MSIKGKIARIVLIVISIIIGIGIGIAGARKIPAVGLNHPFAPKVQLAQYRARQAHEALHLHDLHAQLATASPLLPLHVQ